LGETARQRILGALALSLAGAGLSALLLLQHHGETGAVAAVNQVCGDGQTSGCETVAQSRWSKVGGVPLAAFGLAFYLSLAALFAHAAVAAPGPRDGLAFGALAAFLLALVVDLLLFGVQAFAIKSFCKLCLSTYVLNALAMALLWPARRSAAALGAAAKSSEGRAAVSSWAVASLAFASAVWAADLNLARREQARSANLLGAPVAVASAPAAAPAAPPETTPPSPAASASAPPAGDLKYYQDLAKRLQETIDDPQKLAEYFSAKAAKEYEKAPIQKIDLTDVPSKGPANAPVQVVEFSDFLCPFCRNLAGAFTQFIPQAGNRVVVYFKNYPLDKECNASLKQTVHPGACWLAMGAVCAINQGKFQSYHDHVFGSELHDPKPADVARVAGEAGLNPAAIEGCLADPHTKQQVVAQIEEGVRLGVQATPTLFVNGKKLPRIEDFLATVDKEARAKGFAPMGDARPK
jgi:protein-disulfide isomerase/uncharacterized membrane protein